MPTSPLTPKPKAYFIVSTGRSGSKMLARVLALHPELCSLHEPPPLLNTEAYLRWAGRKGSDWISHRLTSRRDRLISEVSANGFLYVESSHFLSHLIPDLLERYDSRFVHLHRDGRHFVQSGLLREWYNEGNWKVRLKDALRRRTGIDIGNNYRDHRLPPPKHIRTRFDAITWLWAEVNSQILLHFEAIPEERKMSMKLEHIGEETLQSLMGFIGVSAHPETVRRMSRLAASRPNRTLHPVEPPEAWDEFKCSRFHDIAGGVMTALGYRSE